MPVRFTLTSTDGETVTDARPRLHLVKKTDGVAGDRAGDPTAMARAAQRSQDESLAVIAGLELTGQLGSEKWPSSAEELVDTLVTMVAHANQTGGKP